MKRGRGQVIQLRLNRAEDMFALAQTDLFSEYRNYLTGVEYCISLLRSLLVGVPIVVLGYLLVIYEGRLVGPTGNIVWDTTGWVFVWLGIWFPLDTFFFSPLGYGRENRALEYLRDAEITVTTWQPLTP
jgi:hypothetical protein